MSYKFIILFISVNTCLCSRKKPNIVLIVADDLGWGDVSFHGSNQIPTPNIDALAYSGIILHNYYTTQLCTPSRSALMTGMHPIRTGMYHSSIKSAQPYGLPLELKILPQYLKEAGYKTHAVGKWHLGFYKSVYTPLMRGFDSHFGYYSDKGDYFQHITKMTATFHEQEAVFSGLDYRDNRNVTWDYAGKYSTDVFTEQCVNLINSHNSSEPLFLYLAHLAVHAANAEDPLQAPEEAIARFEYIKNDERRKFAGMLSKLDDSVGKIVASLSERGMLEDTIIIFTTDNGGAAGGIDSSAGSNWPLRGTKFTLWEGGVRGTAFIWGKELLHAEIDYSIMHIQDWFPTILAAVYDSDAVLDDRYPELDGRNMWPILKGARFPGHDEILIQNDPMWGIFALRKGKWKIIRGEQYNEKWRQRYHPGDEYGHPDYNIATIEHSVVAQAFKNSHLSFPQKWQIARLRRNASIDCNEGFDRSNTRRHPCNVAEGCLYNIHLDPCETDNLASREPEIMSELLRLALKYEPVKAINVHADPSSNPVCWNGTWSPWMDDMDNM